MKKIILLSITFLGLLLVSDSNVQAQGVSVNDSGAPADPSAILDASSSDKGLLIPRMSTSQRDNIAFPAAALLIYNTTTNCLEMFGQGAWQTLTCLCSSAPAAPGSINGLQEVCTGSSGITYSVGAVTSANTYTWSVPSGATITAGQGTPTISVNFGSTPGNVTVVAGNSCGTSNASSLPVTILSGLPAAPSSIVGQTAACFGSSGIIYSISAVANASSYLWTVPAGSTITNGQGTTSITVTYGSNSGDITVAAVNHCGSGTAASLAISLSGSSGGGSGSQTFSATGSGKSGTLQTFMVPCHVSSLTIEAWGAQGGDFIGNYLGGRGARMKGTFAVTGGTMLQILVGQAGESTSGKGGGGGGGSFVVANNTPLIIAGGGGGAGFGGAGRGGVITTAGDSINYAVNAANGRPGYNGGGGGGGGNVAGGGGGGYCGDGGAAGTANNGGAGGNGCVNGSNADGSAYNCSKGMSYLNGGTGGYYSCHPNGAEGGYGGGAGGVYGNNCGGGGGGYSGGGGGGYDSALGVFGFASGGGSYNTGSSQSNSAAVRSGHGQVVVTW